MTLVESVADRENVATFETPDREAFRKRATAWENAFRDAYDALRRDGVLQGAVRDCPLFDAYCRLKDTLERRIAKLERALTNALASDALDDVQRGRIILALHGTKARDANLLTAAEAAHLKEYRALDEPDRRVVRTLIARLSRGSR